MISGKLTNGYRTRSTSPMGPRISMPRFALTSSNTSHSQGPPDLVCLPTLNPTTQHPHRMTLAKRRLSNLCLNCRLAISRVQVRWPTHWLSKLPARPICLRTHPRPISKLCKITFNLALPSCRLKLDFYADLQRVVYVVMIIGCICSGGLAHVRG